MPVTETQAQLLISGASVLFSLVLVIVTYLYYTETKNHTEEMKKSREAEFRPVIKATIENWHAIHNRFAFESTGTGAGHDVIARWGFNHLDHERVWKIPLMTPGQSHHFTLPFGDGGDHITTKKQIEAELGDAEGILHFEVECKDALGNKVTYEEEIDVLGTIQSRQGERLEKDETREIRKALESVADAVEDVSGEVELDGVEAALKRRNQNAVLEIIEEKGPLTLSNLQDHSGLSQRELAMILPKLKRTGAVEYSEEFHLFEHDALDTEIEPRT